MSPPRKRGSSARRGRTRRKDWIPAFAGMTRRVFACRAKLAPMGSSPGVGVTRERRWAPCRCRSCSQTSVRHARPSSASCAALFASCAALSRASRMALARPIATASAWAPGPSPGTGVTEEGRTEAASTRRRKGRRRDFARPDPRHCVRCAAMALLKRDSRATPRSAPTPASKNMPGEAQFCSCW